jgi:hypothetical protein
VQCVPSLTDSARFAGHNQKIVKKPEERQFRNGPRNRCSPYNRRDEWNRQILPKQIDWHRPKIPCERKARISDPRSRGVPSVQWRAAARMAAPAGEIDFRRAWGNYGWFR